MRVLKYILHDEPVWRYRSDFIFGAAVVGVEPEEPTEEQLWGRQIGEHEFELCCIPFFLYDVGLGDVVETTKEFIFTRVLKPSKRYVFRASLLGRSKNDLAEVVSAVESVGAAFEWYSSNFIAIDCEDRERAEALADILARYQEDGVLLYENGLTKHRY